MLVPGRIDEPELLDQGYGSTEDAQASLSEIATMNRYLGGVQALTGHLYPRLRANAGLTTLADLGTGSAEIPKLIARWGQRHALKLRIIGVDAAFRHLAYAKTSAGPEIRLVQADANCLPFAPDSLDFIISTLFLHHLSPGQVVALLQSAYGCVRRGLVLSDIVRSRLPLFAFRLIQPLFARNFLTKHDGSLSIRRAYTPSELRHLAEAAGLPNAKVYVHLPWRMTLVVDK